MNEMPRLSQAALPLELQQRIDKVCHAFEAQCQRGRQPSIEEHLTQVAESERPWLLVELVLLELEYRDRLGQRSSVEEFDQRFPGMEEWIALAFQRSQRFAEGEVVPAVFPRPQEATGSTAPTLGASTWEGIQAARAAGQPTPSVVADYEILEELGHGGMGVVYRARQRSADRIVALKVIRPDRLEGLSPEHRQEAFDRFLREARAAAQLEHDHIVTVYEVGMFEGRPYYSMRYVRGQSLATLCGDQPIDDRRAAEFLESVTRAVAEAHRYGILHRDLKPSNILVDSASGRALVSDFGLAKLSEGGGDMTLSGEVFGSPPYMSPEQARDSARATTASDVYSLGATFYHLLTGRPPFRASSFGETLRQVLEEDPQPPRRLNPAVNRDLETICLRCLEKDPSKRYASATALAEDLRRYLDGEELGRLDRTEAEAAETRLQERCAQEITQQIHKASLQAEDTTKIERIIAWLARRDATTASRLRGELQARLRAWELLFEISAPFAGAVTWFQDGQVHSEGEALVFTPRSGSKSADVAHTKVPTPASSEFTATFAEDSWTADSRLGLMLNCRNNQGYAFLLSVVAGGRTEKSGRTWQAVIVRNGVTLRQQTVRIPAGPLQVLARREGGSLSLHANGVPLLSCFDMFPLGGNPPGVFAVVWPSGIRITRLRAAHQTLPEKPAPLEQGDVLYGRGQYDEALHLYRAQEVVATNSDTRRESRCKEAMCLLRLNRRDEAADILEEMVAKPGDLWHAIAAAHLWKLRIEQGRWDDAEAVFETISRRYEFKELAALLPENIRTSIIEAYRGQTAPATFLEFPAERLQLVERAADVETLMRGGIARDASMLLVRAARAARREDRALAAVRRMIVSSNFPSLPAADRQWLTEEASWILRLREQPAEALKEINRRLFDHQGKPVADYLPLFIERARVHAAMGQWVEAEEDVEAFFSHVPRGVASYRHDSAACLLLGFLRQRRGDQAGAARVWAQGLYRQWRQERLDRGGLNADKLSELPDSNADNFSGMEMVQFAILASLSNTLSQTEAAAILDWLSFRCAGESPRALFAGPLGLLDAKSTQGVLLRMWQSSRGRECARKIAFQEVVFPECYRLPILLGAHEIVVEGAFSGGPITEDQDAVLWKMCEEAYAAYFAGKVSYRQLLALCFTWKGTVGPLGWASVGPQLDTSLRGAVAYMFGHRYLRLKRPNDAEILFQTAARDAPPESKLRRLAEAELKRMADGKSRKDD